LRTHATMPTALSSRGTPASLHRGSARIAGILAAFCLLAALAGPAAADDQAAIDKVSKLNKKAVDEYENLNFDEARKLLQSALDICAQAGLDKHDVTARTYVHLGVVTLTGFKQKAEAIKFFRRAAAIQPDIKLDKSLANPEIQDVYDQAVTEQKNESTSGGETTPTAPPPDAVLHTPVTRATQGKPIPIKATVDPGLGAKKVILSFAADNSDDFGEREMKEDPAVAGSWVGEIPAAATMGAQVGYYIEVQGDDDKTLASKGSGTNTIRVKLVAPGGAAGKKPVAKAGDYSTWYLGLAIGSGFGYTTGTGEVSAFHELKPAGFLPAKLLHFSPEVGYFLGPDLLLSVQLRIQIVTGATAYYDAADHWDVGPTPGQCGAPGELGVCKPASFALAGLARLSWFLSDADFRPYIGGVAGLGQIRHVATFNSIDDCGQDGKTTCKDTIAAGPVLFGGTAGFLYEVSSGFSLTLGTNLLLGVSHFTFNIDVNAGVAYEF
jgi:hypothetical protein